MTQRKLKRIIKMVSALVTTFVVVAVCVITYQCIKINVLSARSKKLDNLSATLTAEQSSVDAQIGINQTSTYQEQLAREKYGLIKDGETVYIVAN
jgi:cell division protein FtsB